MSLFFFLQFSQTIPPPHTHTLRNIRNMVSLFALNVSVYKAGNLLDINIFPINKYIFGVSGGAAQTCSFTNSTVLQRRPRAFCTTYTVVHFCSLLQWFAKNLFRRLSHHLALTQLGQQNVAQSMADQCSRQINHRVFFLQIFN